MILLHHKSVYFLEWHVSCLEANFLGLGNNSFYAFQGSNLRLNSFQEWENDASFENTYFIKEFQFDRARSILREYENQ